MCKKSTDAFKAYKAFSEKSVATIISLVWNSMLQYSLKYSIHSMMMVGCTNDFMQKHVLKPQNLHKISCKNNFQ
jgi:hypothetical protein